LVANLLFFEKKKQANENKFATKEVWYYEHRLPEGVKAYSKTKPIRAEEFEPIKKWWNKRVESDICWKISIDTLKERNFDLDIKNPNKQEEVHEYSSAELMKMLEKSFGKSNDLLTKLKGALK